MIFDMARESYEEMLQKGMAENQPRMKQGWTQMFDTISLAHQMGEGVRRTGEGFTQDICFLPMHINARLYDFYFSDAFIVHRF